jgi:hypothetical protein
MVVGEVTSEMLGIDFLNATRPRLDFTVMQLQWDDGMVQCVTSQVVASQPRLLAVNDTEVPAGHSMVVSTVVSGFGSDGALGVVEPLAKSALMDQGILVARCVVSTQGSVVPVTVANVGDRPHVIKHGTTLAKIALCRRGRYAKRDC